MEKDEIETPVAEPIAELSSSPAFMAAITGDALKVAHLQGQQIGAVDTLHDTPDGGKFALIPESFTSKEIKPLNPILPDHVQQSCTHVELNSYLEYLNIFKTPFSIVNGMLGKNQIQAFFDYHKPPTESELAIPDRKTHTATLRTVYDPNWDKWRDINGVWLSQLEFAHFIEEMMHTIAEPDGADLLEMAQDLKINRNIVFKQNKRLATGEMDIEYVTNDEAKTVKQGRVGVPEELKLSTAIFMMRPAEAVTVKLRYELSPGEPLKFKFDILNIRIIELDSFNKICQEIRVKTELSVFLTE